MMSEVQYVQIAILANIWRQFYIINVNDNWMIIVFKLTIFNYYFVFVNRQIHLKRLLTV
jgi:hypothetical protein